MSPETEARIDLVLLALELRQRDKDADAPPPGQVTPEYLASLSRELGEPVSVATIRRATSIALAKASHAAKQRGIQFFLSPEN